jgi:hypothetical protein
MIHRVRFTLSLLCAVGVRGACAAPSAAIGDASSSGGAFLVAAGCETPVISARRAHFIDPVRGSSSGDGSRAHPWRTLADVLRTKMVRIHGGDIIYLASGDHGAVLASADNSGFVEVTAEPGQHPVLRSLEITGARWIFSGLKIQSLRTEPDPGRGTLQALVSIHAGAGPASNIVLSGNRIAPTDDVSAWRPSDWIANGLAGVKVQGGANGTTCVSIDRNTISGTGGAPHGGAGATIEIFSGHSRVVGNTIDHFADDAIDFGADDIVISGNKITNNVGVDDGNHNDAIQGFVPGGARYAGIHAYRHIVIDSNLIVRQTDPALNDPIGLQGIDNFGGTPADWYDVAVTNNVVITNTYNGITFGAVHHGLIAHNTVLADGLAASQKLFVGGKEDRASTPGDQVWIMVTDQTNRLTTPGGVSSEVEVEDNISTSLQVLASGARSRGNLAFSKIVLLSGGKKNFYTRPGDYGDHNVLDPSALSAFKTWRPARFEFDLSARKPGKLDGRGSSLVVAITPTP